MFAKIKDKNEIFTDEIVGWFTAFNLISVLSNILVSSLISIRLYTAGVRQYLSYCHGYWTHTFPHAQPIQLACYDHCATNYGFDANAHGSRRAYGPPFVGQYSVLARHWEAILAIPKCRGLLGRLEATVICVCIFLQSSIS